MNRSRLSLALLAALMGHLPQGMRNALVLRQRYRSDRQDRSPAEHQRRITAAADKRSRRRARNIALLRAEQARKPGL